MSWLDAQVCVTGIEAVGLAGYGAVLFGSAALGVIAWRMLRPWD